MAFSCRTFVFLPECWGRVEHHVTNFGLDLCIASETFGLYLCILITAQCHIETLYFRLSGPVTLYSLYNL